MLQHAAKLYEEQTGASKFVNYRHSKDLEEGGR